MGKNNDFEEEFPEDEQEPLDDPKVKQEGAQQQPIITGMEPQDN